MGRPAEAVGPGVVGGTEGCWGARSLGPWAGSWGSVFLAVGGGGWVLRPMGVCSEPVWPAEPTPGRRGPSHQHHPDSCPPCRWRWGPVGPLPAPWGVALLAEKAAGCRDVCPDALPPFVGNGWGQGHPCPPGRCTLPRHPRPHVSWECGFSHGAPLRCHHGNPGWQGAAGYQPSPRATRAWEEPREREALGLGTGSRMEPPAAGAAGRVWGSPPDGPFSSQGGSPPSPDWRMTLTSWPRSWPGRRPGAGSSQPCPSRRRPFGFWSLVRAPTPLPVSHLPTQPRPVLTAFSPQQPPWGSQQEARAPAWASPPPGEPPRPHPAPPWAHRCPPGLCTCRPWSPGLGTWTASPSVGPAGGRRGCGGKAPSRPSPCALTTLPPRPPALPLRPPRPRPEPSPPSPCALSSPQCSSWRAPWPAWPPWLWLLSAGAGEPGCRQAGGQGGGQVIGQGGGQVSGQVGGQVDGKVGRP